MSTRSRIAMLNGNDEIKSIYCHSDGYPEYNGRILIDAYTTKEKINKLLSYGDLSSLGRKIGTKHGFDYGQRPKDTCTFYGRDRGEDDIDARVTPVADFETLVNDSDAEYVYLFKENEWYVSEIHGGKHLRFKRVVDVLKRGE